MARLFKGLKDGPETYLDNPPPESITFSGKKFCLTGYFDFGDNSDYEKQIREREGIVQDKITQKTDYLVVGNKGNKKYDEDSKHNKLKIATELKKRGLSIAIISETHCTKFFTNFNPENKNNIKLK